MWKTGGNFCMKLVFYTPTGRLTLGPWLSLASKQVFPVSSRCFYQGQPMKLWLPEPTPQQQLDTLNRSEHGGFSATNRSCMYNCICICIHRIHRGVSGDVDFLVVIFCTWSMSSCQVESWEEPSRSLISLKVDNWCFVATDWHNTSWCAVGLLIWERESFHYRNLRHYIVSISLMMCVVGAVVVAVVVHEPSSSFSRWLIS